MFSSTGSNHPIIPRQSDLLLNPHYVTFHACDRDKAKYPSSSQWATRLPENINSIRSLHLVDCMIPHRHMFVFKNDYQNLAFMIKVQNNTDNCKFEERKNLFDNCLEDPKCTPRLNLSRPLVPHSNVKFNEDTKDKYVEKDLSSNVINYQLPSLQVQNNFSAPQNCTSYQNNLIGLDNMQNNTCENKVIACQESCTNDCIDIKINLHPQGFSDLLELGTDCCKGGSQTLMGKFNNNPDFGTVPKMTCVKCDNNLVITGIFSIGTGTDTRSFTLTLSDVDCCNSETISIGSDMGAIEPVTPGFFVNQYINSVEITPSTTDCEACEPEPEPSSICNDFWAPRSMCDQQTALLRVNGTVPPYIRKMRELEEAEKNGNQIEFNYDGCNAWCNPNNYNPLITTDSCNYFMIRIKEGFYTGEELAQFLQNELTKVFANAGSPFDDHDWKVYFSSINCKFYFYLKNKKNTAAINVEFRFDYKINYQCQNFSNKNQPIVWNNDKWWGLGYYLGFNKERYSFYSTNFNNIHNADLNDCSSVSASGVLNEDYLLQPPNIRQVFDAGVFNLYNTDGPLTDNISGLVACNASNLFGPSVVYMEIEKYNNCDEIYHNSSNTNSTYNNTYSGATKALFAKLAIVPKEKGSNYFATEVQFITHMKNQLEERINKLEFKFRFHDGRYVYFDDTSDFNFSIQFNCAEENALKQNISSLPDWSV